MISTPSCLSRSRKARFPDMTGKTISRYYEQRIATRRLRNLGGHD
jgi:hypothetical protein